MSVTMKVTSSPSSSDYPTRSVLSAALCSNLPHFFLPLATRGGAASSPAWVYGGHGPSSLIPRLCSIVDGGFPTEID